MKRRKIEKEKENPWRLQVFGAEYYAFKRGQLYLANI